MVLNLTEMGYKWRLKWLLRPNQWIGMTVEYYYTQFHDWKEEMVSLSFPAEEEDYVDGFIEKLRSDIRLRFSKGSLSSIRLINDFCEAKFEESMIEMEKSFKRIDTHMVFDKMPSRTPVVELQQCETTLDKNAEQNEDCEVFVELPKPSPRDVIDEREETITKMAASSTNSAYNVPSFSSPYVIEDRDKELHASLQASVQSTVQASMQAFMQSQRESLSAMIQSVFAQNKLKHEAHKVFEEMSPPESLCRAATQGAEGVSEEKSSDFLDASSLIATNAEFCSMLQVINSVREDVGGLGDSENKALKTFDTVIEPIQESEFSSFAAGVQLVEKDDQSFPSKLEVVELAYEMFGEMNNLVPTARHSFSSISLIRNERNDDSVLNRAGYCKFDEVLGLFSVKHNTRIDIQEVLEPPTFDLLKILGCDFINSNGLKQDFDKMASNLNVELWVGMVPMFVFDPGGSSWFYVGRHHFKPNGDKQNCDFCVDELNVGSVCAIVNCITVAMAVKLVRFAVTEKMEISERKMKERWAFERVNVTNQGQNDKIGSFNSTAIDEGAEIWCCRGNLQHFGGEYLVQLSTTLLRAIKPLTSMGKGWSAEDGKKSTEQPLQELLGQGYDEGPPTQRELPSTGWWQK